MAQSNRPAAPDMSAEEQTQLDQMRADDAVVDDAAVADPAVPVVEPAVDDPAVDPAASADPAAAPRQQMVPHAALHEERERRKEAEQRSRILEERTNLILQRFQQPQTAEPPKPDAPALPAVDIDPLGHIVGSLAQLQQTVAQLTQGHQQTTQQQRDSQMIAALQAEAVTFEQEFRRTTPDYDAAVAHLTAQRSKELELAGFSPVDRGNLLAQEAFGIVARARQQGRNPAEMVYELAKLRGHTTPDPTADPAPGNAGQRIQTAANGQQQARSLSQVRGTGPVPMTATRIIEMKNAEFGDFLDKIKNDPEKMAEYFGT